MSEGLVTVDAVTTAGPEQAMDDGGGASAVDTLASRGGTQPAAAPQADGPDRWARRLLTTLENTR